MIVEFFCDIWIIFYELIWQAVMNEANLNLSLDQKLQSFCPPLQQEISKLPTNEKKNLSRTEQMYQLKNK